VINIIIIIITSRGGGRVGVSMTLFVLVMILFVLVVLVVWKLWYLYLSIYKPTILARIKKVALLPPMIKSATRPNIRYKFESLHASLFCFLAISNQALISSLPAPLSTTSSTL